MGTCLPSAAAARGANRASGTPRSGASHREKFTMSAMSAGVRRPGCTASSRRRALGWNSTVGVASVMARSAPPSIARRSTAGPARTGAVTTDALRCRAFRAAAASTSSPIPALALALVSASTSVAPVKDLPNRGVVDAHKDVTDSHAPARHATSPNTSPAVTSASCSSPRSSTAPPSSANPAPPPSPPVVLRYTWQRPRRTTKAWVAFLSPCRKTKPSTRKCSIRQTAAVMTSRGMRPKNPTSARRNRTSIFTSSSVLS
mmetsp:Transcript_26827/g.67200  ORF Transcript_26827/g.67200 Transcript_26827/m.67200 type:complete len:259 (-) Transcript_26827:343-1119(-)